MSAADHRAWTSAFRLLIFEAVKPSSEDYCRGCHMASYPSGYASLRTRTEDEEAIGELEDEIRNITDPDLGVGEAGWSWDLEGIDEDCDLVDLAIDGCETFGAPDGLEEWIAALKAEATAAAEGRRRAKKKARNEEAAAQRGRDLGRAVSLAVESLGRERLREIVESKLVERSGS